MSILELTSASFLASIFSITVIFVWRDSLENRVQSEQMDRVVSTARKANSVSRCDAVRTYTSNEIETLAGRPGWLTGVQGEWRFKRPSQGRLELTLANPSDSQKRLFERYGGEIREESAVLLLDIRRKIRSHRRFFIDAQGATC